MRKIGVVRPIDELGRIVLPMEFRKKLGIERNSKVLITMNDETVFIKASERLCAMCKKQGELNTDLGICNNCIEKVKKYNA